MESLNYKMLNLYFLKQYGTSNSYLHTTDLHLVVPVHWHMQVFSRMLLWIMCVALTIPLVSIMPRMHNLSIELAHMRHRHILWFNNDSLLVTCMSHHLVPWEIKNRWLNIIVLTSHLHFMIIHTFRERNYCVYKFASIDLSLVDFHLVRSCPLSH